MTQNLPPQSPPPASPPADSGQPAPPPAPVQEARQRPAVVLPWALLAVFVVTTVVFAALFFAGVGKDGDTASPAEQTPASTQSEAELRDEQRGEVLRVAREVAVLLANFDSSDMTANTPAVLALSTESFGVEYEEGISRPENAGAAEPTRSEGRVSESAVAEIDADTATVLIFLHQKVIRVTSSDTRSESHLLTMNLKRIDGRWLVDDVTFSVS